MSPRKTGPNLLSQTAKEEICLLDGICPFCSSEKPLIESHLISKGIYSLVRDATNHAIVVNSRVIMHTSRQTKHSLLCRECDNFLNANGENWIIPKLARTGGQFLLLDVLQQQPPDAEEEQYKIYAAVKNPGIDVTQMVHFAMGIFWKASIHSWSGHNNAFKIELGAYRDEVRNFLRGSGPFSANMSLHVLIAPRDRVLVTIAEPHRGRAKNYHNFAFYVPGVQFDLYVGKQISDEIRQLCFYRNPAHPIVVYDTSERFLNIMKGMARTAHKSQRVRNLFA
jgi:hypothetical protein